MVLWVAWATTSFLELDHGAVLLDFHALVRWPITRITTLIATVPTAWLAAHKDLTLAHDTTGLSTVDGILEVMMVG